MAYEGVNAVVASAARSSSSNSGSQTVTNANKLNLWLNTTVITGTLPTLDLSVEWSMDGTTWLNQAVADTLVQVLAITGSQFISFAVKAPFYRVKWVLAGTNPNYTFSVSTFLTN